jgi:hypothetical protein
MLRSHIVFVAVIPVACAQSVTSSVVPDAPVIDDTFVLDAVDRDAQQALQDAYDAAQLDAPRRTDVVSEESGAAPLRVRALRMPQSGDAIGAVLSDGTIARLESVGKDSDTPAARSYRLRRDPGIRDVQDLMLMQRGMGVMVISPERRLAMLCAPAYNLTNDLTCRGRSRGDLVPYFPDLMGGVRAVYPIEFWATCALMESGAVRCWGRNELGLLGQSTRQYFTAIPEPPIRMPPAVDVLPTGLYNCAATRDGDVYCWGQLPSTFFGTPSPVSGTPIPQRVPSLSNVRRLYGNYNIVCALTHSGQIWCWGRNGIHGGSLWLQRPVEPWTAVRIEDYDDVIDMTLEPRCVLHRTGRLSCVHWREDLDVLRAEAPASVGRVVEITRCGESYMPDINAAFPEAVLMLNERGEVYIWHPRTIPLRRVPIEN